MDGFIVALASSFWLGILTSISPCPLATNVVAISYLSRRIERVSLSLAGGLLYALGRIAAYVLLGAMIVFSWLSIPETSLGLQRYMHLGIGPLLIVLGLMLSGLIPLKFSMPSFGLKARERLFDWGVAGSFPLGFIFALTFCPISAALFFGGLIPAAIEKKSVLLMPALYGAGTALPVVVFAGALAFGASFASKLFRKVEAFERVARYVSAAVIFAAGLYFTWSYTF